MTVAELSGWWIVGWAFGLVAVLAAAVLLITIILLGRRIARQADDITRALDGARGHTMSLFEVTRTNLAVDRIARGFAALREGD